MSATLTERVDETVRRLLDDAGESVLVVDPSARVVEEIVEVATELDDPPTVRLLADESTLKDVMRDFLVASNAADLIDQDHLSMRTADVDPGNELLITDDDLTALVWARGSVAALSTDESDFVESANTAYTDDWEGSPEFSLRTPPLSRVRETLREDIGDGTADDFDDVLTSLETARGNGNGLDEVTISLLVAAKNEELLYDISKWGEDVGIASKATFSRTKTTLEDLGLIDTEKVPIDVGRPRLRLKFGHDKLQGATSDELASVAQSLMT